MIKYLKRFTGSPAVNLVVGLIFLATGIMELWNSADSLVGAHHGAILFSVVHILRYGVELFEGLEHLEIG